MEERYRDDEIDLIQLVKVLREEWKILVGVTAAFAIGAVIYALTATELYRAEAVVVEVGEAASGRSATLGQLGGLASLAGLEMSPLSGSSRRARPTLRSRALAEEFIRRNNLVEALTVGLPVERQTIWRATDEFMRNVWSVREDARAGVITVSVLWKDPVVAAEWANGMIHLANETLRRQDTADAERSISFLNDQVGRTNVIGVQQALFNLIEAETKTLTLANAREEYAFALVDAATAPESHIRPRRTLIVLLSVLVGMLLGSIAVGIRRLAAG